MNLSLVLKRIRHERRSLGVLLVSICLVTAFFSLGPMYVRTTTQSGLKYELARADSSAHQLVFQSQSPFNATSWQIVTQQLGAVNGGLIRISRTSGAIGTFAYEYSVPTSEFTPRGPFGAHIFAFSNLRDLVKLTSGAWPRRLPPPGSPELSAGSEEEAKAKGVGAYSKGEVEAVMTSEVAQILRVDVGANIVVGNLPQNRAIVKIVGIVEAVNPDDPIWDTNNEALHGDAIRNNRTNSTSYDMGFFVDEAAYTDWIDRAARPVGGANNGSSYIWQIALNTSAITADNLDDVQSHLAYLEQRFSADYPGLITIGTLGRVLGAYIARIGSAGAPVILLSGAILVLMLYHLVTTVGLILEQSLGEWSSLSSRGASTFQLVILQLATVTLLCAVGFIVGPVLALIILQVLARIGPLGAVNAGDSLLPGVPSISIALSAIAALAALIVLTVPGLPAARRSLAQFKQIVSRPPMRPTWSRYALDIVLIIIGLGFLARLLFFISGDLGQTLSLLTNDPRQLIQMILDSANQTGGLSDPLNLLGPALLLTGVALLWLRLFPLLMHGIGALIGRSNGLTGPLSVWNVERDPGHYAQLVLLLIGTLALGTAALALGATRDSGAWSAAKLATGGAARVETDQTTQIDWLKLPGVTGAETVSHVESQYKAGLFRVFIAGVDPESMAKTLPETAQALAALNGAKTIGGAIPVVMSERMAADEGQALREDRLPLQVGTVAQIDLPFADRTLILKYKIVGITRNFPSFADNQHFMVTDSGLLARAISGAAPNQVWLEIPARQPSQELIAALGKVPVTFAWDRYNELLREPLPAAIAGMLYAGFWVSLILGLLDFGFYLAVTARRRSLGFAVLQALGWNANNIWALLLAEQTALVIPALIVGIILGAVLAYVILPFLALTGGEALIVPGGGLIGLVIALLIGFAALLSGAAWWLKRLNVNQVLRLGEE